MGPPWGASCQITLTSCYKTSNYPLQRSVTLLYTVNSKSLHVPLSQSSSRKSDTQNDLPFYTLDNVLPHSTISRTFPRKTNTLPRQYKVRIGLLPESQSKTRNKTPHKTQRKFRLEHEHDSYYRRRIGNRTQAFEWHQFQWSWVTYNPDFKVTILFNVK